MPTARKGRNVSTTLSPKMIDLSRGRKACRRERRRGLCQGHWKFLEWECILSQVALSKPQWCCGVSKIGDEMWVVKIPGAGHEGSPESSLRSSTPTPIRWRRTSRDVTPTLSLISGEETPCLDGESGASASANATCQSSGASLAPSFVYG